MNAIVKAEATVVGGEDYHFFKIGDNVEIENIFGDINHLIAWCVNGNIAQIIPLQYLEIKEIHDIQILNE